MDQDILLIQIMEKHGINVKLLAMKCGLSDSAIYKYREGELAPSVFVWATLWAMTLDQRILTLITRDTPIMVVNLPPAGPAPFDLSGVKEMSKATSSIAQVIAELAKIFADGKVTPADRESVNKLTDAVPDAIKVLVHLQHAVTHAFDRACKGGRR